MKTNDKNINIILSSDNNYAHLVAVVLCSIFENRTTRYPISIYIIDGGITKKNKGWLTIIENRYNFKIKYLEIDKSMFEGFYVNQHITQASYYRIIIPELLPNLKKILYLDCDIVVTRDISDLYNTNIDKYIIAATEEDVEDRQKELEMPIGEKYFNAGVMLINLEKWRAHDISKKLIDYIEKNPEKLKYYDQDALNAILWGKWLELPYKYNYTSSLVRKYAIDIKNIKEEITIIHYTGEKPWSSSVIHPLENLYYHYLSKTPWKTNRYINKNLDNAILKLVKKLVFFLLPHPMLKYLKKIKSSFRN